MAINDHPAVRFEQDRSGTWGNAQVKVVEVNLGVRADELATRVMRTYPSMRINSISITIPEDEAIDGEMDVGWVNGEIDNSPASFAADNVNANGKRDYFFDNVSIATENTFFESRNTTRHAPLVVTEPGYITVQNREVLTATDAGSFWMHIEFEYLGNE